MAILKDTPYYKLYYDYIGGTINIHLYVKYAYRNYKYRLVVFDPDNKKYVKETTPGYSNVYTVSVPKKPGKYYINLIRCYDNSCNKRKLWAVRYLYVSKPPSKPTAPTLPRCTASMFRGSTKTYNRSSSATIVYFEDKYNRTGAYLTVYYGNPVEIKYAGKSRPNDRPMNTQINDWRSGYTWERRYASSCTPKGWYWVKYRAYFNEGVSKATQPPTPTTPPLVTTPPTPTTPPVVTPTQTTTPPVTTKPVQPHTPPQTTTPPVTTEPVQPPVTTPTPTQPYRLSINPQYLIAGAVAVVGIFALSRRK